MGVAVGAFPVAHIHCPDIEIVVHIFRCSGSHLIKHFFYVGNEKWLRFLDQNSHCGVKALDVYHASFHSRFFEFRLDLVRDVDEIQRRRSLEVNEMIDNLHFFDLKFMH